MALEDTLRLTGTTLLEKYRVEELVAQGGFALVYRATHLLWNRKVALKVFMVLGEVAKEKKGELLENFIREGALLAELSERSASICQARDVGMLTTPTGDSIPYMVLEWLEGRSLEQAFDEERAESSPPRTIEESIRLLEPIAEALALAHKLGVAHRDVKPANIFLLGDPRAAVCPVKLLDFGIAKVVADAQKASNTFAQTRGTISAFTPQYAAPEQFSRSYGPTGPWTDTFALALVVVECLVGRPVIDGDDLLQIAGAVGNLEVRPTPRTWGAVVSDEIEAVFTRALAVVPADRYETVGDFWSALRLASGQGPMRLTSPGPAPSNPSVNATATSPRTTNPAPESVPRVSPTPSAAAPAPVRVGSAPTKTSPLTVAVGGLALVALAGGATFVALRGTSASTLPSALPSASASVAPPPSASAASPPPACPTGMIYIAGGQFFMGSDDGLPSEKPAHNVKLRPFCIGMTEVTTEQYIACSDAGKCKRAFKTNDFPGVTKHMHEVFDPLCNVESPVEHAKHPINCVDWEKADIYCKAQGTEGRLPTEAEWEFAARGPDGRKYPWGDEEPSAKYLNACGSECVAWGKAHKFELEGMYTTDDKWPTTAPVGSFPDGKSRYGLMDVVGNVWEWVADWYAPYTDASDVDPSGPTTGKSKVIRGGAWNGAVASWVRPTFRFMNDPSSRSYGVGFRCAANPR